MPVAALRPAEVPQRLDTAPGQLYSTSDAAQALKALGVKTPYGLRLGPEAAEDEVLSARRSAPPS
ncbi:hypothetical protein AB0O76_18960 [Streptomyces sp. NPDC086554]|uniref:hypothetical protein n=1 Tax=Streptomyces sp. NPDC086554 TaxID=3154864 RepID=UPI0034277BB8